MQGLGWGWAAQEPHLIHLERLPLAPRGTEPTGQGGSNERWALSWWKVAELVATEKS